MIPEFSNTGLLTTYSSAIETFFNAGGDLFVDSSNGISGYYSFLPSVIGADGPGINQSTGFSATPADTSIGIQSNMINGYPTHNTFGSPDPVFTVFETHAQGIVSIGARDVVISGGGLGAALAVTVNNVAPQLQNLAITSPVSETASATLSGVILDPGTQDTFKIGIDWGDPLSPNNTETIDLANPPAHVTWNAVNRQFSVSHQYLDDNPSGTSSDIYTVTITTLVDDDGGAADLTDSASVTQLFGDIGSTSFNNATSPTFAPVHANEVTFSANAGYSSYAHSHGSSVDVFVEIHDPVSNAWTEIFRTTLAGGSDYFFAGQTYTFPTQSVDQVRLRSNPGMNQTYHNWSNFSINFQGNSTADVTVNNLPPTGNGDAGSVNEDGPAVMPSMSCSTSGAIKRLARKRKQPLMRFSLTTRSIS